MMDNIEYPIFIYFLFPILIFLFWFWRNEYLLLKKITQFVHPSKISSITSWIEIKENQDLGFKNFYYYSVGASLTLISLVLVLSNPMNGSIDSQIQGSNYGIYILIDSSFSMRLEDFKSYTEYDYIPTNRNWESRIHALSLIKNCQELDFGIYSFGEVALRHTGLNNNYNWLFKILYHDMGPFDSKYSGTSYVSIFEHILESLKFEEKSFGIVLYSDGDLPEEEFGRLEELLEIYKNLKIPIHVIAVGSPGEKELSFEYNVLNLETKDGNAGDAAGRVYTTEKTEIIKKINVSFGESILKKIAKETGGFYHATYSGTSGISELSGRIKQKENSGSFHPFYLGKKKSLFRYFLILPLCFFFYDYFLRNKEKIIKILFRTKN